MQERFITESHSWAVDEHVLLSLASCRAYKVIDDKLNVLPISSQPQPPHIEEDLGVGGLHQTDVTPHDSPRRAVYQPIGSYTASASRQYGTIGTHP